jgi:threonine dehydrogenase-like Zn-dependent dehydrogenase
MKTISLNGPGSLEVVEQELDQSFERIAVLKVISSGICAADSYLWSGKHPWSITYPIVPGHEVFGEVIEINSKLESEYPLGSKVSVQVNVPCYECPQCLQATFNLCASRRHFGSTYKGSFAEKIAIPRGARMHRYAKDVDDLVGGLSETMANAIYCCEKMDLVGKKSVIILGMGSIGACLTHYLNSKYPNLDVTVLTSSDKKQKNLDRLRIKSISLAELSNLGESFDILFETSGYSKNFQAGIASLKSRGTAMVYGVFQEKMLFDFNQVGEFKELTLIGGHLASDSAFELSVEFLSSNHEELKYLISNVVGFYDFSTAFTNAKFSEYKTIFQPSHVNGVSNGI